MGEPFAVPVRVRGYELDTQGHLNQAVYLQYAEHARWEFLLATGISQEDAGHRCRSGRARDDDPVPA